jgi:hypothetical protein
VSIDIEGSSKMESFIHRLPDSEFNLLETFTVPVLAEQLETVRTELAEFEEWLGAPPADATDEDIQAKLLLWDTCRQWFVAYDAELFAKRREIASLDEELAETRGMMRGLERTAPGITLSHDEEAARDAHLLELEQRAVRVLSRLEELGAPLPGERVRSGEWSSSAPAPAAPDTRSHIQRQLDEEWELANHSGPGCPFCDSLFGACGCWERRREAHEAEERRRQREDRAAIARAIADGKCYCDQLSEDGDYPEECDICRREEELRCTGCGQLECRPGCCGDCGGCSRCRTECKRCGGWEDQCCCYEDDGRDGASSCGCGACEEHRSWGEGGCW